MKDFPQKKQIDTWEVIGWAIKTGGKNPILFFLIYTNLA